MPARKKTARDDARRINKFILPKWGSVRLKALTRAEIASLHHKIGKRAPYEANRLLALIRKMLNCARQWGFMDEAAATSDALLSADLMEEVAA